MKKVLIALVLGLPITALLAVEINPQVVAFFTSRAVARQLADSLVSSVEYDATTEHPSFRFKYEYGPGEQFTNELRGKGGEPQTVLDVTASSGMRTLVPYDDFREMARKYLTSPTNIQTLSSIYVPAICRSLQANPKMKSGQAKWLYLGFLRESVQNARQVLRFSSNAALLNAVRSMSVDEKYLQEQHYAKLEQIKKTYPVRDSSGSGAYNRLYDNRKKGLPCLSGLEKVDQNSQSFQEDLETCNYEESYVAFTKRVEADKTAGKLPPVTDDFFLRRCLDAGPGCQQVLTTWISEVTKFINLYQNDCQSVTSTN